MTRTISAAEANRQFSEILRRAAAGETVIITRRGEAVAKLAPIGADEHEGAADAAWTRLLETLAAGASLGGERFDRERLHERDR